MVFESKGLISKYSEIRTYGIPWFYRPPKWGKSCQGEGSFAFPPHRARRQALALGISAAGSRSLNASGYQRTMKMESISGDGDTSRWCTLEESSHGCGWVSVMCAQKKCDEEEGGGWLRSSVVSLTRPQSAAAVAARAGKSARSGFEPTDAAGSGKLAGGAEERNLTAETRSAPRKVVRRSQIAGQ